MWHYRTLRHFLAVVCLSGLALPLHADPPTLVWTGISPGQMIVSGSAYAVGVNLLNGQVGVSYTITITRNGGFFNSIVATNTGSLLVLPPKAVTPPDTGNVYVNYLATASGSGSYCASTAVKIYLPDNTPPSAPSGLVASDIRAIVNGSTLTAQFTVQWTASTENQLIDHYDVQLNGATVSTATSPGTATIYTFTGLAQGTTYTVAVRAVDWAGNVSSWSSPILVTTPVSDVTPPTKPGALTISGISSTGFVVAWGASTDNVGVQGYTAQVLQGGSVVSFQSLTSTTTSCLFSGLQSGTAYQVSVVAFDAAGNNSAAQTANVTTTGAPSGSQPGKPVGLAAPILMDTSVTISWSPAVDGHPVDHYVLNCNGANTVLGTDSSTGKALTYYCFTGLTASTAYTFKVEAVDPGRQHLALVGHVLRHHYGAVGVVAARPPRSFEPRLASAGPRRHRPWRCWNDRLNGDGGQSRLGQSCDSAGDSARAAGPRAAVDPAIRQLSRQRSSGHRLFPVHRLSGIDHPGSFDPGTRWDRAGRDLFGHRQVLP